MNEWISVEDRLPEDEIKYLVYGIDGETVRGYNPDYICWDTEDQDDFWCHAIGGRVTHWQPLPPPPEDV